MLKCLIFGVKSAKSIVVLENIKDDYSGMYRNLLTMH